MTMPRMSFLSSGAPGAACRRRGAGCPGRVRVRPRAGGAGASGVGGRRQYQVLSRAVTGKLSDGQAFRLEDASQWRRVGALVQGDVYRPLGAPVALSRARARRPIWWRLPDG